MHVLGGVLVVVLLVSLALAVFRPAAAPDVVRAAVLADAESSHRLALAAMRGEPRAFAGLAALGERLSAATQAGVDVPTRDRLEQIRTALGTIAAGRDELIALRAAADRLDREVPVVVEEIYALQKMAGVSGQALAVSQLDQLRTTIEGLRRDVRALSAGSVAPREAARGILDAEMATTGLLDRLVDGDPALGLKALSGADVTRALGAIRNQAVVIVQAAKDVLASGDRLDALNQSVRQINTLVAELPDGAATVAAPGGMGLVAILSVVLLLLSVGLAFAMIRVVGRMADNRREVGRQIEQNERNQQAIMTLLDEMSSLADGDLTVHASVTEDITGAIADSINYAIEALRELVTTINESAIMVDAAARQTEASARQLATASEGQSRQIEAASRSIARMASSIEEISGNAERSSDVARHSVDVAHKGGDAVRRTIEGMNVIRETIQETSKRIKRLGESSQEIGNIVELINDIADQTNILALNAAIQASMAGEAGRGFAVVADEVQRLAERSANATRQIEVLVRTIQSDTNEAVVCMDRSTTDVVGGALLAENAGAALEEIEQVSNQIASLVQNISSSAREQSKAASAVTRSMDVLQEINTETATSTSATTSAISKLAELATQLRRSVAGFRLPAPAAAPDAAVGDDASPDAGTYAGSVDYVSKRSA